MFDLSAYLPFEAFVAIGFLVAITLTAWGADNDA